MARGIIFYLLVWVVIAISITAFRTLSGKEKWSMVKTVSYGAVTAVIALIAVGLIVTIF